MPNLRKFNDCISHIFIYIYSFLLYFLYILTASTTNGNLSDIALI